MIFSDVLNSLPSYAFAEVDKMVYNLKNRGINPIDFGVGDPQEETPKFIRDATKEAIERHKRQRCRANG